MDLIERYVAAVGRRLPRAKRDDIERELRSSVLDALETRNADPRDEAAVVQALRELGRPEDVARSYHPVGGYLIGPEIYPTFRRVSGIVLTVLIALVMVAFVLSVLVRVPEADELGRRLVGLSTGLIDALLAAFGVLVLIFALIERTEVRLPGREVAWDPRSLPAIRVTEEIGRLDALMSFVIPATIFVLANLFRDRLGLWVLPRGELLLHDLALEILPWLNAALLAGMVLGLVLIASGRWHWSTRLAKFGIDLFGLYVFWRLSLGLAERRDELLRAGFPEQFVDLMELVMKLGVAAVVIAILWGAARLLFRGQAPGQPKRPVM